MQEQKVLKGDMEAQLSTLYEERRRLALALGTADATSIIAMVRSLEEQLLDLYQDRAASSAKPPSAKRADPTQS